MITNPILFPLVKPFRASRSGKPFYVHPLTADTGENKASVRTENFTEYPIWYKLWKAAGKFSVQKLQRHLMFLPSAVPLHVQNELDQEAPTVFKTFPTRSPRERISSNRSSQIYSSESPRNPVFWPSWRWATRKSLPLWEPTKWSEVEPCRFSLWQRIGISIRSQSQSAELCLVSRTRSKTDGTSFPKGSHFRHRMKYDKSEVVTNICELTA